MAQVHPESRTTPKPKTLPRPPEQSVLVDLTAVVVAATDDEPRVLVVRREDERAGLRSRDALDALPSGPLELRHRTLEAGLRAWVEEQTRARLGYVEQLYTFGDRARTAADGRRILSIGYLALAREAGAHADGHSDWRNWYRYFPWEDWRRGRPAMLDRLASALAAWTG
jgi:hypothetical protein